ncbi:MAG: hypothetical protein KGZ53_02420 [Peptococcaceae bacterium]|nr:hypothetical protein [Peptococcaceae bacterium]
MVQLLSDKSHDQSAVFEGLSLNGRDITPLLKEKPDALQINQFKNVPGRATAVE